MKIRTFLDASALIAAHRGTPVEREQSLQILNDGACAFVASPFLYLETVPKAAYYGNEPEVEFYRTYFDSVKIWISDTEAIVQVAREESERAGLAAMDALHVAAAYLAKAAVLYTLERKGKVDLPNFARACSFGRGAAGRACIGQPERGRIRKFDNLHPVCGQFPVARLSTRSGSCRHQG